MKQSFMVALFFLITSTSVVSAQNNRISLHGFGGWAYGRTDNENRYLVGDEDGDYEYLDFSLNIAATPVESLSLHIQPSFNENQFSDHETKLDYAFAEWMWSNALKVRVGKVKAPFMLYTEVYDVGTIRPFFLLPPGVYREFAAEAYKGIGVTGNFFWGQSWEVQYDLYGGKLINHPKPVLDSETRCFTTLEAMVDDFFGGRLLIQTPLKGFSVGISSFAGKVTLLIDDEPRAGFSQNDDATVIGLSAEYLAERWSLRSEYLILREHDAQATAEAAYLEMAYYLTPSWQVAARYEIVDFEPTGTAVQVLPDSFLEHEELVLDVNYWVNPHLVFKSSYHRIDGNRFANPATPADFIESVYKGSFEEITNLVLFGVQFSF